MLAGAALIIPIGLLRKLIPTPDRVPAVADEDELPADTKAMELIGMETVAGIERTLGFEPEDVSAANRGYDIESRVPGTGKLRFLEVKGRRADAKTVFVTKNEVVTGLNKGEDFFLAIVLVDGEERHVRYVRAPFGTPPDFNSTMVVYDLAKLWDAGSDPRLVMETVA